MHSVCIMQNYYLTYGVPYFSFHALSIPAFPTHCSFVGMTENAGVENVAQSSGAYSGFQVRLREVRASAWGRETASVVRDQSRGRKFGDDPKKLRAFYCMKA